MFFYFHVQRPYKSSSLFATSCYSAHCTKKISSSRLKSAKIQASYIHRGLLHVCESARHYVAEKKLVDRCSVKEGSFFQSVPEGGSAYLLKVVLHDWDDARAVHILKNCHEAMNKSSRLIVIDRIVENDQHKKTVCLNDINMLVTQPGRERTMAEYNNLLQTSGFKVMRIIKTSLTLSIIEAEPD